MLASLLLLAVVSVCQALDNGLALTPPMGWLTWQRFRCITDCVKRPNECISEQLIRRTADRMVEDGYLAAGYNYVAIDDCWLEHQRDQQGRLVADRKRFPNGMKAVGDYLHEKGLKFGLYEDYGNLTCAGFPGVLGHEDTDVDTMADWGVDYLKLDGCYIDPQEMDEGTEDGYPLVGQKLNTTGRKILYSCSWPAYQEEANMKPDYRAIAKHCNLWRNFGDIEDSWQSLTSIISWFGDNQERFARFAGPGHWNDPDMLLVGNYGLSLDQARVQMAVWAVMAAPLLISADLDAMRPEFRDVLLNRDVIAVNQDPLGVQGLRVWKGEERKPRARTEVWTRPLTGGALAVAIVSLRQDGAPYAAAYSLAEMRVPPNTYRVKDLYHEEKDRILQNTDEIFEVTINPSGVKFFKFIPEDSANNVSEN